MEILHLGVDIIGRKDGIYIAEIIDRIINDEVYRNEIIESEYKRLDELDISNHKQEIEYVMSLNYHNEDHTWRISDKIEIKNFESVIRLPEETRKILEENRIIIYGFGKAGKKFMNAAENEKFKKEIEAICDNGYVEDAYHNIRIMPHEEMIRKYQDQNIIITIQRGYRAIRKKLVDDGIDVDNIYFADISSLRLF